MNIQTKSLVYDSTNDRCTIQIMSCNNMQFAFVEALDIGHGYVKRYWGEYDAGNQEASIKNILLNGNKWPTESANKNDV